ncbi:transposase [Rhizobium leguminosarum]|jgi:transposase|uniref:Helix-turn-helix domain family protein n=1 Tax=Rhizobium leguminosarum TaxID=384 RepID=A0A2Z4YLE2_RHILE|nr:helix-turn-helix domain-containing protein [Rhizobium leguminosarum]AVC49250.1 helix-turn-helix domain protein [Rhizobium leguminosarum bv. viciae]MDH6663991.1 transposase [Rhizobium sophorae]OAV57751.1 transcriptional regulator [Rhizobium sp. WYCCWR10014]OOO54382.1 transcriptional regulator [Rhizobium leguminosarum bv. viciae USDA 2370]AVC49564.1 winged helix-turn helix family protein [Rhizobium leguminosarum bv. viciae]
MSNHSLAFKLSVVEFYEKGERSAREVGAHFAVDHGTVRKWVASYEAHGVPGLAKKFSHYDAAFKLSVLQRMWKDGLSYRQTAALFDIRNKGCLSDWERRYETGGIDALTSRRKGGPRSMSEPPIPREPQALQSDEAKSREELLSELNYLRMENDYLKKLEALTRKQPALKKRKSSRR